MNRNSKKITKESTIQNAIQKHLKKNGWFTVKIIMASKNGIPDVVAIKDGRVIFLEIKNEIGRLSEIQKYRIEELKSYGSEVYVVRGIDDLIFL